MLRYKIITVLIACCILSERAVQAADGHKEHINFLQVKSVASDMGVPQRGISIKKIVKFRGPDTTEYRIIYPEGYSKVARFHHAGRLQGQYFLYCDSGNVAADLIVNQYYKNSVDAENTFHFFKGLYEQSD